MVFGWLRRRRRRKLARQDLPGAWLDVLQRDVRTYPRLPAAGRGIVRDYVKVFVGDKHWEGCGGLELTDQMRVIVAAEVAILVLGFEQMYFDNVLSILVYPDAYVARQKTAIAGGAVIEHDSPRIGETSYRGPVVLAWSDVLASARGEQPGRNVVLHEFAHQLDFLNGRVVDGVPPLKSREKTERWRRVMHGHYDRLSTDCGAGRRTLLDCYGATDPCEFFAVATEAFFEMPVRLQQRHHDLYDELRGFYGQDPAAWRGAA